MEVTVHGWSWMVTVTVTVMDTVTDGYGDGSGRPWMVMDGHSNCDRHGYCDRGVWGWKRPSMDGHGWSK